jgi:hypothetical protein
MNEELRLVIELMQEDSVGPVLMCACGASRYCPPHDKGVEDRNSFNNLHNKCMKAYWQSRAS